MDDFIKKWHDDKKYRAKVKLILYFIFIVAVSIYAISLNKNASPIIDEADKINDNSNKNIIDIPEKYSYTINVDINDIKYTFTGNKDINSENITKTINNLTENYIINNNEYYKDNNGTFLKTTKESVYDPVNYDYIDLHNINLYLEKAIKNNQEYLVYVKNIILGSNSEDYFIISIKDNQINIDYTPLMKQMDNSIYQYLVHINIDKE